MMNWHGEGAVALHGEEPGARVNGDVVPGKQTLTSTFGARASHSEIAGGDASARFGDAGAAADAAFWFAGAAPERAAAPGEAATPAVGAGAAGGSGPLLVEDGGKIGSNQMAKGEFLRELHQLVPSEDVTPWLSRPCAAVEQDVRKRVPGAASARSARDYLSAISTQARTQAKAGTAPQASSAIGGGGEARAADAASAFAAAGESEHAAAEYMRAGGMGAGRPLEGATRAAMETAFQASFGGVRVHVGEQANTLAGQLHARAFTVGDQIAFGAGNYAPGTPVGDALLAHELAHVVQQQGATTSSRGDSFALDADADHAAAFAVSALHGGERSARAPATPAMRSGVGLQRCPGDAAPPAGGGALTFTSASHTPGAGGAVTATPSPTGLKIQSSAYASAASVQVTGGTDADAQGWDVGYLQTARAVTRVGHYIGSPAATTLTKSTPANARDGNPAGVAPWYDSTNPSAMKAFTKTATTEAVALWDQPSTSFSWDTVDGKGKLDHTDGKDKFTAWVIVRKRAAPNTIQFINWESWEVDFSTSTNYSSAGAKTVAATTGATTSSGSGAGQGASAPNLTGTVGNNLFTTVWS